MEDQLWTYANQWRPTNPINPNFMKFIYCLLLGSLISATLHSQNCKTLGSKPFFSSIKFGDPLPSDLLLCSNSQKLKYPYNAIFRIEQDSLNQDCKNRYSDLFTFLSTPFSFLQANTNNRGQIFYVILYSFFDDNRQNDSMTYNPPVSFTDTYKKLVSIYGEPTRTQGATGSDSLFVKESGMPMLVEWECNDILLQLRVTYGSRQRLLNVLAIQITNRQFDLVEELQQE